MPVNVGFRVTGMYFGAQSSVTNEIRVDVPSATPTVYDVMVEVAKKVAAGGVPGVAGFTFDPIFPSPTDSLNSITVEYSAAPKPPYNSGVYFLQESKMGNPIHVFQYYIFSDEPFVQKNNNNQTAQFNAPPDVPIVDNDIVIWRQVAILQGANGVNRVKAEMVKAMDGLKAKRIL